MSTEDFVFQINFFDVNKKSNYMIYLTQNKKIKKSSVEKKPPLTINKMPGNLLKNLVQNKKLYFFNKQTLKSGAEKEYPFFFQHIIDIIVYPDCCFLLLFQLFL